MSDSVNISRVVSARGETKEVSIEDSHAEVSIPIAEIPEVIEELQDLYDEARMQDGS